MLDEQLQNTDLLLVESEARYRAVIENASDMIQSVLPDGTFEFVNDAWRNTLGYTDSDLAGMTVFEIVHPDFIDHCMADFMRAINGETVDFLETQFLTKDGRAVPVEGSVTARFLGDEVVATHGFFRDISERLRTHELEARAAKLELQERARYMEKMLALGKLSAGLVHELNNPVAAMQRANASLPEMLQRRDAAMIELASADLDPTAWRAIEAILGNAQRTQLDPVALSAVESAIEASMEGQGIARAWELAPTLAGAGITVEDLTALSAQVPPASLAAALQWISESLVLKELTDIVAECCRRIADLMLAIKGYSHMDGADEYDGDIHDGLENTLIILGHRLRNVDVVRNYDRSIPQIHMYSNTLNQVWTNILDNALDAMDEEGQITIRTMTQDDQVVIEIEDNGCGIPEGALPRIFEPFFTSKPQGQGNGLGLDIVWRIVTNEHAGSITVTSRPGQTVFRIAIPLAPRPQTEAVAIAAHD
jgi:PAS domain S-box-containing protein